MQEKRSTSAQHAQRQVAQSPRGLSALVRPSLASLRVLSGAVKSRKKAGCSAAAFPDIRPATLLRWSRIAARPLTCLLLAAGSVQVSASMWSTRGASFRYRKTESTAYLNLT